MGFSLFERISTSWFERNLDVRLIMLGISHLDGTTGCLGLGLLGLKKSFFPSGKRRALRRDVFCVELLY